MAGIREVNDFVEEISILQSMFGGTVSDAVITTVIESCDGNVHLAADAIMNFADEMSTPSQDATESIGVMPIQATSELNVDAQPFVYQEAQTTTHQPSSTTNQQTETVGPTTEQEIPTTVCHQLLKSLSLLPSNTNLPPSTTARQQSPTTENQQSARQPISAIQPPPTLNQPPESTSGLQSAEPISDSFSGALRSSGALPKKPPDSKPQKPLYKMKNVWHEQVANILHYHNQGTRTLIMMRGVSGSGKTHLAKNIIDYAIGPSPQNYSRHIFSSDNYFMRRGVYQYNRDSLQEAHETNQRQVCEATNRGVSPVIVDNTNTELWEMEPYIRDGVRNGYVIEFVEPNTPWARNASQLEKRNTHGVPRENIRRMLDRYERGITIGSALKTLRFTYPPNKKPPVRRNIPPFSLPGSPRESPKKTNNKVQNFKDQASNASRVEITSQENQGFRQSTQCKEVPGERYNFATNHVANTENSPDNGDGMPNDEQEARKKSLMKKKIIDAQQQMEEFEKVEHEWENGEGWEDTTVENNASTQSSIGSFGPIAADPKPPRWVETKNTEKLTEPNDDWTTFMQPWPDSNITITNLGTTVETPVQVESKSIGTGFEIEDMNEYMHTVLLGNPRDINEGVPEKNRPKIPKAIVVDKSTSTHDNDFLSKKEVCKNKEHHFIELRRMLKSVPGTHIPSRALRDIFVSCNYDVNWAVNLVLDSYPESQENVNSKVTVSDDDDDEAEGPIEECNCLAGYNIVPDVAPLKENSPAPEPEYVAQISTPVAQKKPKRENKSSDNSLQLKRQIEKNVNIPDSYYSHHYLNLRRRRENNIFGPVRAAASVSTNANTEEVQNNLSGLDMGENATALREVKQNAINFRDVAGPSTANNNVVNSDPDDDDSDNESDSNKSDNPKKTVSINMGPEFLEKLDELFGRKDFQYPRNIQPMVNLPMSILEQINAHWAMSVAFQLDGSTQSEAMIKQDEEFARVLAAYEQEMSEEGKEPEVPTLKEIMDMEVAYAIHEREIGEWRNNEPQDLAAKLSREKLYNLFPGLSKEVLSEMLMAHSYSFKETIESLIISTGQSSWLEDEKGVEKFVMHKEMERKEKFLEEQQKNLDEEEWPYLSNPDKPITLETVDYYRAEAEKSLQCRNVNFEKARQYFIRNNPSAASFYSDIAALHTRKYEQSSGLAAAYLMNYHLMNNPDQDLLDLHFLRVSEAMVNLDIFLDQVILKLRTKNINTKETWIITGKGNHSVGGPRIKPATKKRLKARDITSKQINGGLLMAKLHRNHKMTSELSENNS